MRKRLSLLMIIIAILSGCNTAQVGISVTYTPLPTSTPLPLASITPTISHTPTPEERIQSCQNPDLPNAIDNRFGFPGVLAVVVYPEDVYLYGGLPLQERRLQGLLANRAIPVGFSPNGQWFAYATGLPSKGETVSIHLLSASGQEQSRVLPSLVPPQEGTGAGTWAWARWIGDGHILAQIYRQNDPRDLIFAVLDPLMGQWRHNLSNEVSAPSARTSFAVSPDLTLVVYTVTENTLVLWDLTNQRDLWQLNDFFDTFLSEAGSRTVSVIWNADSSWFVFNDMELEGDASDLTAYRVYRVDRDGAHITTISKHGMWNLALSPDGRYLVGRTEEGLHIYDVRLAKQVAICPIVTGGRLIPFWSPDGRHLAYERDLGDQADPNMAIEVWDLPTGTITRLLVRNSIFIGGWSPDEAWLKP